MVQPPPEFNEQHLIIALQEGQPESLGLLYDKYAPVLLGLATRIMRDEEAAETVLQHTFVAIWERRADYDASRLSLLSWLILITRDMAMAALQLGESKNAAQTIEPAERMGIAHATRNYGPDEQAKKKVKETFCNLAPNEKAALDLVYLHGYTCPLAAAELGINEETLRTWLKTAGQQLREGRGK